MQKKFSFALVSMIVISLFTGCPGPVNPLYGTWLYTDTDIDGSGDGNIFTLTIDFSVSEYEEIYSNEVYVSYTLDENDVIYRKGSYSENGDIYSITINQVALSQDYIDFIVQEFITAGSSQSFLLTEPDHYYDWDTYAVELAKIFVEVQGLSQTEADNAVASTRNYDVTCVVSGNTMTITHPNYGIVDLEKQ